MALRIRRPIFFAGGRPPERGFALQVVDTRLERGTIGLARLRTSLRRVARRGSVLLRRAGAQILRPLRLHLLELLRGLGEALLETPRERPDRRQIA